MQRKLHPNLEQYFYEHCAEFIACNRNDPAALIKYAALTCVGLREHGGDNKGQFVEYFQKTYGDAHGESWCMSFVQSIVAFAECVYGPSPLFASESCLEVWSRSPHDMRAIAPQPGSIIIWQYNKSWQGHTGIVVSTMGEMLKTIEGNTSEGPGINRQGDGVYARGRSRAPVGALQIVGFLNPFPPIAQALL